MADRADPSVLYVSVLGDLRAVSAGKEVALGGPKERIVLALLLARASTVVSADTLMEGLWAGRPPRSAERTLQAYVARLRSVLEPGRAAGTPSTVLVTIGNGYRLELRSIELDAAKFEVLARSGADQLHRGDEGAAATLRQALDLWRDDAYRGFDDVEPCAVEARRLEEMRVVALEDRIDADLAAGAASELVAELESLVAAHAFRERFWRQLMLALYRSGRQRDALATFQRARGVLTEQLGIEPGPDLRQLEAAILDQDPKLERQRQAPAGPAGLLPLALDAVGPAFVGRDAELAWLREAWSDAATGRGRFVSVLGVEGIGKTRLVAALAQEVQRTGAIVLYGRCDHAHRSPKALLDLTLRSGGASLSAIDDETPHDLAAAVARFLTTWAVNRPILIVLDDLHLADTETLEAVADLASWSAAGSMLVVAGFRTVANDSPRHRQNTASDAAQITLGGLDRHAVSEVCMAYATGDWTSSDINRLQELTSGVPLQVHEQASEWARQRAARRVEEATDRSTAARARLAMSRGEIAESVESIQHLLEARRANLAAREAELGGDRDAAEFALCPYKGLAAFEAADAASFFGRERLVAELVARLAEARFLCMVGPSGSGKSSVVRAGLLPALAADVIPVSDGWQSVIVTPGARPTMMLRRALSNAGQVFGRRLVFVDQFEETFILCTDHAERSAFVEHVVDLAGLPDTVVVVAIRADYLGHCATFPALADLMAGSDVLVGPMRDSELRRAIELPSRRVGLGIEPGLIDLIVADVAGRAGALPLLSTALAETWERRSDRTLTLAGYHASGGVDGALARMAEAAYQSLGDGSRASVRRLLLRLCDASDDGVLDLRRRLRIADLAPEGDRDAQAAVEAMVDRRLLSIDGDTVEVAHEALLREWPRLRIWLEEDVQGRQLHRRMADAARTWRVSNDPSELYRGARLDAALEWAGTHSTHLNDTESAFLDASRDEASRGIDEARRRIADERRTNRRLRVLLGGAAALLVVAVASGVLFLRQRNRADAARRTATAHELAQQSTIALDEDPELSMLLAIEALRSGGDAPLPEAVSALQHAVQASRLEYRRDDAGQKIDASSDGHLLATTSADEKAVVLWDEETGTQLRVLPRSSHEVLDLTFSPDGGRLAVSYAYGDGDEDVAAVVLWDTATGAELSRLRGPPGDYASLAFSPDGRLVAAIGSTRLIGWDATSGVERFSVKAPGDFEALTFLPDGKTLLVGEGGAERIAVYSAEDGQRLAQILTPSFVTEEMALDPTGEHVALSSQFSVGLQVWNLRTRTLEWSIATADGGPVAWSPRGDVLAIGGGNASPIRVVDGATGKDPMILRGHESGSWDIAFTAGGDRLASVGQNGGLRVWDVTTDGAPSLGGLTMAGWVHSVQIRPDGSELVVTTRDGAITRRSSDTGDVLGQLNGQWVQVPSLDPRISRDGRWVATVEKATGRAAVYDLTTMDTTYSLPPCTNPVGLSPNGSQVVLDGRLLCTAGGGMDVATFDPAEGVDLTSRVVEVSSGETVMSLGERNVYAAAFNPDGLFPEGRYLAVNVDHTSVEIYDLDHVANGPLTILNIDSDYNYFVRFDPTGRWLTGGTANGRVWVLDMKQVVTGIAAQDALVMDTSAHVGGVVGLAMNNSGILATAGVGDGFVKLWDIHSEQLELALKTDPTRWSPVEFSPDGSFLLYNDGVVLRRYYLHTDKLIALAESRLRRRFTDNECRRYLDLDRCP